MSDIVERLRHKWFDPAWRFEAADEIERLRRLLKQADHQLRAATIEECMEVVKKRLVGWSIHPGGLARQDEAEEILDDLRALKEQQK